MRTGPTTLAPAGPDGGMADAAASKAVVRKGVRVQVPLRAPVLRLRGWSRTWSVRGMQRKRAGDPELDTSPARHVAWSHGTSCRVRALPISLRTGLGDGQSLGPTVPSSGPALSQRRSLRRLTPARATPPGLSPGQGASLLVRMWAANSCIRDVTTPPGGETAWGRCVCSNRRTGLCHPFRPGRHHRDAGTSLTLDAHEIIRRLAWPGRPQWRGDTTEPGRGGRARSPLTRCPSSWSPRSTSTPASTVGARPSTSCRPAPISTPTCSCSRRPGPRQTAKGLAGTRGDVARLRGPRGGAVRGDPARTPRPRPDSGGARTRETRSTPAVCG